MTGAGEGRGGEEGLTEKSKQNRPPPKLQPIEMLSEFRGEYGSIGQDLLDRGEYQDAINSFDKSLNVYPKSVYYMYGKGLALARLGKHEEAIEYYDKIIETSEKYLLDTLQSIATFIDLYKITFSAFYEKWNSFSKLRKFVEASLCFDKTKEYLEAWPPEDKTFRTWENFWIYRARTFLKKQDNVERCLSNLEKAFLIYKESHDRMQWPIFIERIKEEKDFKAILNDEHFKEMILSSTSSTSSSSRSSDE